MSPSPGSLPSGGLSLRLAQAVAAVQGGEIHSVANINVCREVGEVRASIERCMVGMSASDRSVFQLSLGLYCLAVATRVVPLWGAVDESGAGQQAGREPGPGRAAQKSTLPHGNHGDNNCQGSLPL